MARPLDWSAMLVRSGLLVLLASVLGACGGGGSSSVVAPPSSHPFLIVDPAEFATLRSRRNTSPWREVADEAIRYARDEVFEPSAPAFQAKTRMADLCGAIALAWILDPRSRLRTKLVETLEHWNGYYEAAAAPGAGTQLRWQQSAMVESILALDVMRDALATADRERLEAMVDDMVRGWWSRRSQDGTTSTPGVTTIWALYAGDRTLFEAARSLYLERLFGELTDEGVFAGGTGYAWVRYAGDRLSKYLAIDVLVRSGENPDLYADARLRTFHEWLFAGGYTPMGTNLTFGDSDPSRPVEATFGYWVPNRAPLVSEQAGRNAAWLTRDIVPRPGLVNYLLMDVAVPAEAPVSHVWKDIAVFREPGGSQDGLLGALWCPTDSGGHSHKDVNAVHLCAYGENLVVNSGYCGSDVGVDATFDWEWIFDRAASSNTVSIDGADHVAKRGAGTVAGFAGAGFDFATADSGNALSGGDHLRSLWMVHGTSAEPGYFVLVDEVDSSGDLVCLDLHPDSATVATVVPGLAYEWEVPRPGRDPVALTLFLATVPASAELRDAGLCAFDGNEYVARALRACHELPTATPIVTLAIPHDTAHPAPTATALGAGNVYSGARLEYASGVTDLVLGARGDALVTVGPESFRARAAHVRRGSAGVQRYFAQRGRVLDDGAVEPTGFEADRDVDVLVSGTEVRVSSTGAEVLFRDPDLSGALATTPAGTVLDAGPGFVRIALAPGTIAFDLETGALLP